MQKRILAIHDISCVGRCSMTVVLPIISSFDLECSIIPTTVLSTHLGFEGFIYHDLESEMLNILNHYKQLDLKVDALYAGYLGNENTIKNVLRYKEQFSDAKFFLDPVFGDNGKLYSKFDLNYVKSMLNLVNIADCLIPNLTEACYLLGIEYKDYKYEELKEIVKKLSLLGPKTVVLTGAVKDDKIGAIAYDSASDKFYEYYNSKIEGYYHGTGDIFSSVIVGALSKGKSLLDSIKLAVDFTYNAIRQTYLDKTDKRYGVRFEKFLSMLSGDNNV